MKKKTISTASVVGQSKDIIASDIDDEKVMMNMEKGHCLVHSHPFANASMDSGSARLSISVIYWRVSIKKH